MRRHSEQSRGIPLRNRKATTAGSLDGARDDEGSQEKNLSGESIGCGWQMRATQCSQLS
jgi:hypothetical protein